MLLVTTGHPDMLRYAHPNLGRLVQPRHFSSIRATAEAGIPWAADNDCFQGLDAAAFERMLDAIRGLPGCLFVTCPDVVGDAAATLAQWAIWRPRLEGFPVALVLQDGQQHLPVPWDELVAVFVGGSTEFKVGPDAARLVAEAKRRGKFVHMGRVNTPARMAYAKSIGCDSVDGTSWARWKQVHLRRGLTLAAAPPQLRLEAS
jgi:hypothetical protein